MRHGTITWSLGVVALSAAMTGCAATPLSAPFRDALLARSYRPVVPPPPPATYPSGDDLPEMAPGRRLAARTPSPEGASAARRRVRAPGRRVASLSPEPGAEAPRISHAARVVDERDALAREARRLLGRRRLVVEGRRFRSDCSGFAQAVYATRGIDLYADGAHRPRENGVAIIYDYVHARGGLHRDDPRPGDLVFFDDTDDRNRDGRRDDPLTHVAIVESIRPDGTAVLVHFAEGHATRAMMNLRHPHRHRDPRTGRVVNSYLRRGTHGPRLTAELFAGFGTLVR